MKQIISLDFQEYIKKVIKNIFTNLIAGHLELIQRYTILLIDTIAYKFNYNNTNINNFHEQLIQNNNRDIISIMYLLLPYIDDKDNFELFKQINILSDITCKKKPNADMNDQSSNLYLISNFQFSRCFNNNMMIENIKILQDRQSFTEIHNSYYEYRYTTLDLEVSFKLVLDTIEQINSKLYINWINVIPLTLKNYKNSNKYKNSFYYSENNNNFMINIDNIEYNYEFWNLELASPLRSYGGLNMNDVFNAIYVYLFKEIYESGTKWLIYEKQINKNEIPMMYIEKLNNIVDINFLYSKMLYDTIDNQTRKNIELRWQQILLNALNNIQTIDSDFIKCIIFRFDLKYCDQEIKEKYDYDYTTLYKKIEYKKDNVDEDIFLDFKHINIGGEHYDDYIIKLKDFKEKIPFEVIYDFLTDVINSFKMTWYGKQILQLKDNKIIIKTILDPDIINNIIKTDLNTFYITYKNIYNYAKIISLDFQEKKTGIKITDARCLDRDDQELFIQKLNNSDLLIPNIIKKTYGVISKQDIIKYQDLIKNYFKNNLKDLVFITYIQLGLLNEFITDSSLTDEILLGSSEKDRKKNLKKRLNIKFLKIQDEYLDTDYYLTRDKYINLELYNSKLKQINWFEHIFVECEPWYASFAMNWVSQINFFHHYINNRVILVTGSTGQGKSTEVPKLLLYATIAINLNSNARVISTQPTIAPTKKNAEIISINLGVPIKINNNLTFSSYVQYSTQDDKHMIKDSTMFIKEVTDRTLLEEILLNPYLKIPKSKSTNIRDNTEYRDENLYDIIIIDEAHMHNMNMDLILTLMRNVLFINNQIKLVITSATMDDDEYIYRRYYRILDENYNFPITIKKCFLESEGIEAEIIMDKIVVDRRYHISPPGQTTKYIIKDKYIDYEPMNYEEAEQVGISILNTIMKKNHIGDVLFFTTTGPATLELVAKINENSPSHVIALPLYAKLRDKPGDWFDKIQNINQYLKDIVYSKKDILGVIQNGDSGYTKISPNTYTMAIIVATNVVEASITIPTLKFVIDTGYFNSVIHEDLVKQSIEKIPEASRLQRRGRVGRVACGLVFYTYKEKSRANIKPRYGITTQDITYDLFKLLHNFKADDIPLFDPLYHPCNFISHKINKNVENFENFISHEKNIITRNIYMKQYFFNTSEVCNQLLNPFNIILQYLSPRYNNGYQINDLIDSFGQFYIIHPGEEHIKRNIMTGHIIYDLDTKKPIKEYLSDKIIDAFTILQNIKYIYFDKHIQLKNLETEYQNIHKFNYNIIINNIFIKESNNLGFLLNKYGEYEILSIIKTISVSACYNCIPAVLAILALIYSITSYKTFVALQEGTEYNEYNKFIKLWKDNRSELFSYLRIMNFFINLNKDIIKKDKIITSNQVNTHYDSFITLKKKYGNKLFVKTNILEEANISDEVFSFLIKSNNLKYNNKKRITEYNKLAKTKLIEKNTEIDKYCKLFALDTNTIKNALKLYEIFNKLYNNNKDDIASFKLFYPVILTNKDDNIIKTFLENYLINVCSCKNNLLNNVIKNSNIIIPIPIPTYSLITVPKSLVFYIYNNQDGPIGITSISSKIFNQVISDKTINVNDNYMKEVKIEEYDITNITQKFMIPRIIDNNDYSMNSYVKKSIDIFHVKKYKLKTI